MSSPPVPSVIALGETMAMVTSAHPESLASARELRLDVGGAESNVAAHLAALGVAAAWCGAVGRDVLGRRVRETVASRGVDTRWVQADPEARTGVYFKEPGGGVLYYRDRSAASLLGPVSVVDVPLERADVVHLSGITPALSPSCAALVDSVLDRVADSNALLSFDVNHRAPLWDEGVAAPSLRALANRADLVFVGLDEAQGLWGCERAEDVRSLLPGPARLVVKDADVGASEFLRGDAGDAHTFVPAIPTEVVEAVGAGDAFAGGYLAALLGGEGSEARLRAGHERARLVLGSTSDFIAAPDGRPGAASSSVREGKPTP